MLDKKWIVIIIAGLMEVVWATFMDMSDGFTKIPYLILTAVFLIISMYLLSKALSMGLPVGTGYAVWTGIGAVGTIVVSVLLGNEVLTPLRILFVAMIIGGIIGLQATSPDNSESKTEQ